jgi:hypothetical protein
MKQYLRSSVCLAAAVTLALVALKAHADDEQPTAIAEIKRDKPVEFGEVQKILA